MPRKLSASGTHTRRREGLLQQNRRAAAASGGPTRGRSLTVPVRPAGELRNIKKLKPWGLADVLADKYDFARAEAQALADFILPMLDFDPSKRATAAQMLAHPWLSEAAPALDECD